MSRFSGSLGPSGAVTFNGTLRLYAERRPNAMISFSGRRPNRRLDLKARIGLKASVFTLGVDVISGLTRSTGSRAGTAGALCLLSREPPVLFYPSGTLGPNGSVDALPDFLRQHGRRRC
jgi:hypothetical protein